MLRLRFCSSALSTLQQFLFFPLRHLGRNSLIFHTKDACRRQMLSLPLAWVSGEFHIAHLVHFCLCLCMWCVCTCVFMFAYGQVYMHACMQGTCMCVCAWVWKFYTDVDVKRILQSLYILYIQATSLEPRACSIQLV